MPNAVPKPVPEKGGNKGIGGSPKKSGTYFEHVAEDFFDAMPHVTAKRILGSGALGVISNEPRWLGDISIEWDFLSKPILAECKFGYGGKTQITLKREWVDKIVEQASLAGKYPALLFKFKGARGDNAKMIALTWGTWKEIMIEFSETIKELQDIIKELEARKNEK